MRVCPGGGGFKVNTTSRCGISRPTAPGAASAALSSIASDTRAQGPPRFAAVLSHLSNTHVGLGAGWFFLDQRLSRARLTFSCKASRCTPTHTWRNTQLRNHRNPGQDGSAMQLYI